MNEGQKMSGHNDNKKKFFPENIQKAKQFLRKSIRFTQIDLYWLSELSHAWRNPNENPSCVSRSSQNPTEYPPRDPLATLITYIDSIHNASPSLTEKKKKG